MILSVLEQQPLHGYAIIDALAVRSGGQLDTPTGTIYPALRRLEVAGYVESTWSEQGGRRRRTYRLTRAGRKALTEERQEWAAFSTVVNRVLRPA
jgi:PadR family transcriptional regulator, regulatory protein PadR